MISERVRRVGALSSLFQICTGEYLGTSRVHGAGGGNRTHGLGIMRPSLYH